MCALASSHPSVTSRLMLLCRVSRHHVGLIQSGCETQRANVSRAVEMSCHVCSQSLHSFSADVFEGKRLTRPLLMVTSLSDPDTTGDDGNH